MKKPKMLIFDVDAPYMKAALDSEFADVEIRAATSMTQARTHFHDADVICALALPAYFSDEWIAEASSLKWIQALTSGADTLASLRTLSTEVIVTNMRGIAGPQMAELAFLYMLSLPRKVKRMLRNQQKRMWERWAQPPLCGLTVAIIGVGAIAEALARRCKAFDMHVIGVVSSAREVEAFDRIYVRRDIGEAVAGADFVISLLPYASDTREFIGPDVFAAMKATSYFINLGRGGVVDEQALLLALENRQIAGAGLDVFSIEPLPKDHPFWRLDNVMLTPHIGGMTTNYKDQVLPVMRTNLRYFLKAKYESMINRVHMPSR